MALPEEILFTHGTQARGSPDTRIDELTQLAGGGAWLFGSVSPLVRNVRVSSSLRSSRPAVDHLPHNEEMAGVHGSLNKYAKHDPVRRRFGTHPGVRSLTVRAAVLRSGAGFVSDEPVKSVTIYDLAVRSAPRLRSKGVHHPAADGKFVEPLMEN